MSSRFPTWHISELLPPLTTQYKLSLEYEKQMQTWKNTKQLIRKIMFSLFFILFQVFT